MAIVDSEVVFDVPKYVNDRNGLAIPYSSLSSAKYRVKVQHPNDDVKFEMIDAICKWAYWNLDRLFDCKTIRKDKTVIGFEFGFFTLKDQETFKRRWI